jgi:hypothetical protein
MSKVQEALRAREDDELDRTTKNLPAFARPALRLLFDVMLTYCATTNQSTIDTDNPRDDSPE